MDGAVERCAATAAKGYVRLRERAHKGYVNIKAVRITRFVPLMMPTKQVSSRRADDPQGSPGMAQGTPRPNRENTRTTAILT